jgi:hypothetical protein
VNVTLVMPSETALSARVLNVAIVIIGVLAAIAMAWPLARLGIHYPIDGNESWNALLADRAMGNGELYPSIQGTFFNNYPPLSFYIVGLAGQLIGDNIVAGRLISLTSILIIGANIAWIVRNLGGELRPAILAGALFAAIIAKSFTGYTGVNDPQLLAQAVMSFGFAIFSAGPRQLNNVAAGALIMVAAGFIKHNIVAMPLAATLWLAQYNRPMLVRWLALSLALLAAGFALCDALFGPDFFAQLTQLRSYHLITALTSLGRIQAFIVPLIVWVAIAVQLKTDPQLRMVTYLIIAGAVEYALTQPGDGVAWNCFFDWAVGACVGLGVGMSRLGEIRSARRFGLVGTEVLIVVALVLRQILLPSHELLHLPAALADLRMKEAGLSPDLTFMRGHSGPAVCEEMVLCYWSGHQSLLDLFGTYQARLHGQPNYDDLKASVSRGELSLLQLFHGSGLAAPAETSGLYQRYETRNSVFFYR